MRPMRLTVVIGVALLIAVLTQGGGAAQEAAGRDAADWPMYRGDLAATGYSPLAEITADNVASLAQVWTYSLAADDSDGAGRTFSQATPTRHAGTRRSTSAGRMLSTRL